MKITKLLIYSILVLVLQGCKVNQRENGQKVGKWVYKALIQDSLHEISKGKYDKQGFQKGVWKTKVNGKLYKKEIFKQPDIQITYYYPNGLIKQKGQAKIIYTTESSHFYYHGNWFNYDTQGKITQVKNYKYGKITSSKNTMP